MLHFMVLFPQDGARLVHRLLCAPPPPQRTWASAVGAAPSPGLTSGSVVAAPAPGTQGPGALPSDLTFSPNSSMGGPRASGAATASQGKNGLQASAGLMTALTVGQNPAFRTLP